MKIRYTALFAALVLGLSACGKDKDPAPATSSDAAPQSALGKMVGKAIEKAGEELRTKNLSLDGTFNINGATVGRKDNQALPKGEISPQGDLLIEGKAVTLTDAQRADVLAYREQFLVVAEAGMAIGVKGADLAGKALTDSLGSILSGNTDEFSKKMEAEGDRIEAEALQLCKHLPALLHAQQKLSASVTEFQPYARMTEADVDNCGKDNADSGTSEEQAAARAEAKQEIRDGIRSGIRDGIREAVRTAKSATAEPTAPVPPTAPAAPSAPTN